MIWGRVLNVDQIPPNFIIWADGYRGLVEVMAKSKDHKKTSVKPFMVKNHLSIFVNCMIENPAFDSQVRVLNFCLNHCMQIQPVASHPMGVSLVKFLIQHHQDQITSCF